MKILIYSDNHWCQNSSLIRGRGEKYSKRLENQIESLNWVERTADDNGCQMIICAGDFFDRSDLNSEEISALQEIKWSQNAWHIFMVGNHDASNKSLTFNSMSLFNLRKDKDAEVVDTPQFIDGGNCTIALIPYISQTDLDNQVCLDDVLEWEDVTNRNLPVIMFSHNDLKDVQFGSFISKTGLSVDDIEKHCDICFNGHLHNGGNVSNKIINIGNLTGQNFSEDAFKYKHGCYILDTDKMQYEFIENPNAFNFYKLDINVSSKAVNSLADLKDNAIVTVRCPRDIANEVENIINSLPNILYHRIIGITETADKVEAEFSVSFTSVDHLQKFRDFIHTVCGVNEDIDGELKLVCEG